MAYLGNRQVTQYQSIPQGQVVVEMASQFIQVKRALSMLAESLILNVIIMVLISVGQVKNYYQIPL